MSDQAPRRFRVDNGFVGGAEGIVFGIVVFVFGILLMFNAWAVVDTKMAVSSAARETARTYVESDGSSAAAFDAGHNAFAATSNFDPTSLSAPQIDGEFRRCGRIDVTYTYTVPAISLPGGFGWGGGFEVTATHSELVDPFRSGLDGEALCDIP
jgi:Flp pilus assembly protein TadG